MATIAWSRKPSLRRPEWVLALMLSLAAIWVHVTFLIHAGAFWRDEVNTINVAGRHSLGDMANDSFPLLMPLVVRGWLACGLGGSDVALRVPGVLIGLGILAALWLAAWAGRRSPPGLSLALFGLNSTTIIYGDSLRAFGLGSMLVVLMMTAMWGFLLKPSWTRTGFLGVTAILSVQALFQNAIFVTAMCTGGWVLCWRRRAWQAAVKILAIGMIAAASLLPYWSRIVLMSKSSTSSGIATLRTEFRPAIALDSLSTALGFPLAPYTFAWGFLFLAVVALAGMAWQSKPTARNHSGGEIKDGALQMFAGTTLLIGLAGFAGFLWYAALRTQPWYFLPLMAMAAASIELGLPPLRRYFFAASLAFVAATGLLAVPLAWRAVHCRFTNVDELARRLAAEATPEDFVLVTPWNRGISFAHYFQAKTPWDTVPPLEDHLTHRYDLLQRQTQTRDVMRPVFERIAKSLQTGHRVWVVGTVDVPTARAPVRADLQPPPLEHTGWSAGPYTRRWTAQAAQYVRNHSHRFVDVPLVSDQSVNANEMLGLWIAEGWENPENAAPAAKSRPRAP